MKLMFFDLRDDEPAILDRYLKTLPADCTITATEDPFTLDYINDVQGCDAIVTNNTSILGAPELEALHEAGVRAVSVRCIGYNQVDLAAAKRLGIRVCNTVYPPYGVAEFTIMLMLMALRNAKPAIARQQVNNYVLKGLMGRELRDLTVGVVGTGRIGRAVLDNLRGFGCKILAYDPYPAADIAEREDVLYVELDELIRSSDLITLHVPLMDATRGMINAETIEKMRDGVVIINVSRGELVDIDALTQGIEAKKIGAVAMDVFPNEDGIYFEDRMNDILANRDMAYLRQFPNVVLTQHLAYYTEEDVRYMVECGIENAIAMLGDGCDSELWH